MNNRTIQGGQQVNGGGKGGGRGHQGPKANPNKITHKGNTLEINGGFGPIKSAVYKIFIKRHTLEFFDGFNN